MFTHRKFDVSLFRAVEFGELVLPSRGEAVHDSSLGCNSEYADLRGHSWAEARRVLALESELIRRIEKSPDVEAELESIEESLYESPENLYGLDIGVASTVICLSAANCIPFSSCNGGAFGGLHQEAYPLVVFFAKIQTAERILGIAEGVNVGLVNRPGGCLMAYATNILSFRAFAAGLLKQRQVFSVTRRE